MLGRVARVAWVWFPLLIWMAAILWMSGRSDLPVRTNPQTGETIKTTFTLAKMAHVFEYSVLGLLLLRACLARQGGLGLSLRPSVVVVVVSAALFGGIDEFWQSMTPTREPRLTDVALDTASALVASLAYVLWRRVRISRLLGAATDHEARQEPSAGPFGHAADQRSSTARRTSTGDVTP